MAEPSTMMLCSRLSFMLVMFLLSQSHVVAANKASKEDHNAFDTLVKAVRKAAGYVHASIGILAPTPSGAPRGIGIVKKAATKSDDDDVLLKVPYSFQMTRELALSTLTKEIPLSVLTNVPLEELDDAALLVLLLAHEYGLGKKSKFYAYIKSLPKSLEHGGACGWAADIKDARDLPPGVELDDIDQALQYAYRVSNGMAGDYGEYLANTAWPKKDDPALALRWALCIVNSRATAATTKTGATGVRLIPLADMANHFKASGGFIELSGEERVMKGDFMDARQKDAGDFVVRSIWKCGTSRKLELGEEITVNYNLPAYSPVDWFLSLGFVPPEVYFGDDDARKKHVEL